MREPLVLIAFGTVLVLAVALAIGYAILAKMWFTSSLDLSARKEARSAEDMRLVTDTASKVAADLVANAKVDAAALLETAREEARKAAHEVIEAEAHKGSGKT